MNSSYYVQTFAMLALNIAAVWFVIQTPSVRGKFALLVFVFLSLAARLLSFLSFLFATNFGRSQTWFVIVSEVTSALYILSWLFFLVFATEFRKFHRNSSASAGSSPPPPKS